MSMYDLTSLVLAQGVPGEAAGPAGSPPAGPGGAPTGSSSPFGGGSFFFIMILLLVFMVFTSVMSGRKDKRRKAEMLASLARNAKVQTVGGVIGTIVEVKNDEVVLKVDEASNTRIRFSRSAIQQVLKPGFGAEPQPTEP